MVAVRTLPIDGLVLLAHVTQSAATEKHLLRPIGRSSAAEVKGVTAFCRHPSTNVGRTYRRLRQSRCKRSSQKLQHLSPHARRTPRLDCPG